MEEVVIRQKPSPLPQLTPEQDRISLDQWRILLALADAIVPSITPGHGNKYLQHPLPKDVYDAGVARLSHIAGPDSGVVASYLDERPSTNLEFKNSMARTLNLWLTADMRAQLTLVLSTINTRAGALVVTGYATPLYDLSIEDRQKLLLGWANSRIPVFRMLFRSMTTLIRLSWIRTSPTLGQILSYPRTPVHEGVGQGFPFQFLQIPPSTSPGPEVVEADVVIVGSGCGGAVAAKTLSEAGLRVLVVDKRYYWAPEHLPMSEDAGANHLFANGGMLQSDDGSIVVLGGSVWGGGGTVNWSAALHTQGFVRREWAQKFGLKHFESSAFQNDMDEICERMGVSTAHIPHNKGNQVLLDGSRKLGWAAKPVPQNTGGEAHNCGYCTLGCGSCGKKGPTETFLPDAARAGAHFMEGFDVQEILFADEKKDGDKVAIGVKGFWTSRDSNQGVAGSDRLKREVIVKAPRVIVSGGSLMSPLLLLRSNLKNSHIGRHLHLHPVSITGAVWDEDIRPWEGPILTTVVNEFENMDHEGYGVKLECVTMLPGLFLPNFVWQDGLQWKELAAKMRRMTGYISLARDRYGGQLYPDAGDGRARVNYTPSKLDRDHILEGVARTAEILYVEGAREIIPAVPGLEPFVRPLSIAPEAAPAPSINDPDFAAWIQKLRKITLRSGDAGFASAHQMGTCRMGTTPHNSVVDPTGRVWGTQGLWICDASVFPSASGVNPMVTTMGISRGTARRIAEQAGLGGRVVARL